MFRSILSWALDKVRPVQGAARRTLVLAIYTTWWSAQACLLVAGCLLLSAVAYCIVYWLWVPQPLYEYAVHFGYAPGDSAELLGAPLLPSRLSEASVSALPEATIDLRDVALGGGWQRGIYAARYGLQAPRVHVLPAAPRQLPPPSPPPTSAPRGWRCPCSPRATSTRSLCSSRLRMWRRTGTQVRRRARSRARRVGGLFTR